MDISKFNYSHDQPEEDRNRNNSSQISSKSKVKVVGINLLPIINSSKAGSKKGNRSEMGFNEVNERGKDMPISFKDASKKTRKECPGTSMGIHGHQSSHQFINYFPKPSPKYKDDDITDSNLKMLEPYNPEFSQLLNNATGMSVRPSQYSGTVMNSAKQSVVENSTISGSMKPKFDLSKQINEINQKKFAKDKRKLTQAKEFNPQGERRNSSSTQKPIKKPQLNIEIEDEIGKEEEESLNKPLQVEGLGWNDAQIQQNVMESFRNYLHNIIQNPQGAVPHQAIDITQ